MKQVLYLLIGFLVLGASCSEEKDKVVDKAVLIEYAVPFYLRSEGQFFYGIRTNRFTYIENSNEPWLLFDEYVGSSINMVNTDEYTFIQLDLKCQLQELISNSEDNPFLQKYDFYYSNSIIAK